MMGLLLIALLALSPAAVQERSTHVCDVLQEREQNTVNGKPAPLFWNPLVGAAVTLLVCGPRDAEQVPYDWTMDGTSQPNPGKLTLAHYEAESSPDWQTAGRNGLVPYVSSVPIVTLPSPGPHVIRVTYGNGKVATFTWIGSTCSPRTDGAPLGELTIYCRSTP